MNKPNNMQAISFDMQTLGEALQAGHITPVQVVQEVVRRIGDDPHHAWISRFTLEQLTQRAEALMAQGPQGKPLYGLPFAVKDNIDLAGLPTTAACPEFAREPAQSATVVQRLIDAGAIPIGKTNLDQFATGLNGSRSPYGACRNAVDPAFVSGGSSSGSAVSLALGQVSFSLGTDTAGSGRVPAAFNQLVGLKPTCGLLSTQGVVPACRSLDAVSIFAFTAEDALRVLAVAQAHDPLDAYSRPAQPHGFDVGRPPLGDAVPRVGVPLPAQRVFLGDAATVQAWQAAFEQAIDHARALGLAVVEVDIEPLLATARLLYEGPWVAERYLAIRDFIESQPEAVFPVTREITHGGKAPSAADAFAAQYQLQALRTQAQALWQQADVLLMPTVPCHPRLQALLADPIGLNSHLGRYTNHLNLLDWVGVAVPSGRVVDQGVDMPFGVTLMGPAHQDVPLLHLAARWQRALAERCAAAATLGATGQPMPAPTGFEALRASLPGLAPSGMVQVAVCGAHLQGQPLNWQLTQRGARRVACTHTSPDHRLYELAKGPVPVRRPALVRMAAGQGDGAAIEVEVWEMPVAHFGSFVAGIPAPLGIGRTRLADGREVPGFICEPSALVGAIDVTAWGGWRAWLNSGDTHP